MLQAQGGRTFHFSETWHCQASLHRVSALVCRIPLDKNNCQHLFTVVMKGQLVLLGLTTVITAIGAQRVERGGEPASVVRLY